MRVILLIMIGLSVSVWAGFSRDDATQIVTDNNTGLQWQDDVNISMSWTDAIAYCEALSLGGHTDWRLPNHNELFYIANRSIFKNVSSWGEYWSSTTVVHQKYNAWTVDFKFSNNVNNYDSKTSSYYSVRCVRDGQ